MCDKELYEIAVKRARNCGVVSSNSFDIIVCLEKEIECYRNKIAAMQTALDNKSDKIADLKRLVHRMYGECIKIQPTTQLEAVYESTAVEIIKALSDNGYNTITINCYKDIESEEN